MPQDTKDAPENNDPNQNNMGLAPNGEKEDYGTWDWRVIKIAITGAVNTDLTTAQSKLPGTSDPDSLTNAGNSFSATRQDLQLVHDYLVSWHDYLVGFDDPKWTGPSADAFRDLMNQTIASVRGHLSPLTADPPYEKSLWDAGTALRTAINTVNKQDYDMANAVIERWKKEQAQTQETTTFSGDYTYYGNTPTDVQPLKQGDVPWYTYKGTTIVRISYYPDMDKQLSEQMRGTLQTLADSYRTTITAMPPPAALPTPDPGPPSGAQPDPIKFDPIKIDQGKPPKPPKQPPPPKQPAPPDLKDKGAGPDAPKLGPDAPKLGADGQPLGPDGQPLGPDGQPLGPDAPKVGPDGQPLGPDGQPLDDPNLAAPGDLVNTPNGPAVVGPDGKTLLDPKTGKPLTGPDGKPLTVGDLPKTGVLPGGPKAPPVKNVEPPNLKAPPGFEKLPPGVEPPNLRNLTSGGPPAKSPAQLQSEGALKSGAKEFGPAEGGLSGGRGAAEGRGGEPMPMGGGGMGGAGAGEKDRDRTTWLVEDEEIWGAETTLGGGVLGR